MASRWVLVLVAGPGDPRRKLGGLALALRLGLDAQAAGAAALVTGDARCREALGDGRLKLPLLDAVPDDTRAVELPWTWLAHRGLLRAVAEADARAPRAPGGRNLATEPFAFAAPYGFDPIDVLDDESAHRAEAALFRSLRKPQDGWTSRWLNRPISLALSRQLVKTPLTPNQVSVGILGVGMAGAWLASRGDWTSVALGGLLFHTQSVLDGCDGEMSRVTHRGSLTGEWLDTVGDDITNYGFFGAAAYGCYRATANPWYLALGAVTVACGLIVSTLEYRYLISIGSGDLLRYPLGVGSDAGDGFFDKIQPLFKRDTFVFLTFLSALSGQLRVMLWVFGAGALGILASVLAAEARMARERRERT